MGLFCVSLQTGWFMPEKKLYFVHKNIKTGFGKAGDFVIDEFESMHRLSPFVCFLEILSYIQVITSDNFYIKPQQIALFVY